MPKLLRLSSPTLADGQAAKREGERKMKTFGSAQRAATERPHFLVRTDRAQGPLPVCVSDARAVQAARDHASPIPHWGSFRRWNTL